MFNLKNDITMKKLNNTYRRMREWYRESAALIYHIEPHRI